MAGIGDPRFIEQLKEAEQKLVELKRAKLPEDKREYWMPTDGSGLIPEEVWLQFSPKSNRETGLNYKWEISSSRIPNKGLRITDASNNLSSK
jgi:hypothetical protein